MRLKIHIGEEKCHMSEENEFCVEVVFFPNFPLLIKTKEAVYEAGITIGAQSTHFEDKGACAGSVYASMINNIGCENIFYVD